MPFVTKQESADLFMSYNGVDIYYTYKDDDKDQGANDFHFVLNEDLDLEKAFDIRELSVWREDEKQPPFLVGKNKTVANKKAWEEYWENKGRENHIKTILIKAIDSGELKPYDLFE